MMSLYFSIDIRINPPFLLTLSWKQDQPQRNKGKKGVIEVFELNIVVRG